MPEMGQSYRLFDAAVTAHMHMPSATLTRRFGEDHQTPKSFARLQYYRSSHVHRLVMSTDESGSHAVNVQPLDLAYGASPATYAVAFQYACEASPKMTCWPVVHAVAGLAVTPDRAARLAGVTAPPGV